MKLSGDNVGFRPSTQPTTANFDTSTDTFPSPAPGGTYGTNLGVFNGISPNGAWNLFVRDDLGGDLGAIAQGWELAIQTA